MIWPILSLVYMHEPQSAFGYAEQRVVDDEEPAWHRCREFEHRGRTRWNIHGFLVAFGMLEIPLVDGIEDRPDDMPVGADVGPLLIV